MTMAVECARVLAGESPGKPGDPELWLDAQALDYHGGLDPGLVQFVLAGGGGGPWIGQLVRLPAWGAGDTVYLVVSRRISRQNRGEPYYVLRRQGEEATR
jgi:hypothetical protein